MEDQEAKLLAKVYSLILSWDDPTQNEADHKNDIETQETAMDYLTSTKQSTIEVHNQGKGEQSSGKGADI